MKDAAAAGPGGSPAVSTWLRGRLWARAVLAFLCGAAMSLTQSPADFWPLAVLGPAAAFWLASMAQTPREAAAGGLALGFGYFLPGLSWIGSAFFVDADKFAWMAPFAITLLPLALAIFWAIAFATAQALADRLGGARSAVLAVALAACWATVEWARGFVLTGFPWGLLSYAWIDTPIAQTAAWIGPYALSFVTLGAGVGLGWAAVSAAYLPRAAAAASAGAVGVLALAALLGALRAAPAITAEDAPLVRLVQPNVPQTEKWASGLVQRNFDWLMGLSARPEDLTRPAPDLVIWPETAVPFNVAASDQLRTGMMARMPPGAWLVLGGFRPTTGADGVDTVHNSLFAIDASGAVAAIYDKRRLVPFGEFLPFQGLLRRLGLQQLAGGATGFAVGEGSGLVELKDGLSAAALICYEAVFPQALRGFEKRPRLLLQITNDAWFGDSGGPRQHLTQARFRAIEQGLPFVRSANTGVTAAIDPYGEVIDHLDIGARGAIDVRLPDPAPPTLYLRYGDLGMVLLLLISTITVVALSRLPD